MMITSFMFGSGNHQQEAKYGNNYIYRQPRDYEKERRDRESYESTRRVAYHENKTKIAIAQAELKKIEAEYVFRQCLVKNRRSSDLGLSGIPKDCEDFAKVFRLLGSGVEVDKLIEDFKK